MQNFTLTITENDRCNLLIALGTYAGTWFRDHGNVPEAVRELTKKIALAVDPHPAPVIPPAVSPAPAAAPDPPAPAATATPAINHTRELWATKFSASTPGVESLQFEPIKVERKDTPKGERLVVLYTSAGRNIQASCWHEELFGHIANRTRQRTTFYVTRKNNYINIVGLLA